jgi:hypothetical protein
VIVNRCENSYSEGLEESNREGLKRTAIVVNSLFSL